MRIRQKHNVRREGIISNALGFMNRLNGLFTSAAFSLVFLLFGFESGNNPGTQPDNAARFLLTVFPFILMLISFGFSFLINFNKAELGASDFTGTAGVIGLIDKEGNYGSHTNGSFARDDQDEHPVERDRAGTV